MKNLLFGKEARTALLSGINKCADAVKVSFGASGRLVMIRWHNGAFRPSKDGVSIAREIQLDDLNEDTGASLVRSAAEKTVSQSGDGTTLTSILTQALCNNGMKAVDDGANPVFLKKGMNAACDFIVEEIKKITISAKDKNGVVNDDLIKHIAMISSNSDEEIGGIVAKAVKEVGPDGMIAIENSSNEKTILEKTDGVLASTGFNSMYFITDKERNRAILENPYILLYDRKITMFSQLKPILEQVSKRIISDRDAGINSSLLIFCEQMEGEPLATLVANKTRGALPVCVVNCPAFGLQKRLILEDLAAVVGGQFISEERGLKLEKVQTHQLGRAKKVIVNKDRTEIIEGQGNAENLEAHIKSLAEQIKNTEDEKDLEYLKDRYAKLTGGVALIKVGGTTPQDVQEKCDRIDDSLQASRAAISEGILPGGGSVYLKLRESLISTMAEYQADEIKGVKVIYDSLEQPLKQLLSNAGIQDEEDLITKEVSNKIDNTGYNLKTNKIEDLVVAGVIDPAKVLRCALQNSVSVATMFLMTECSVYPIK